MSDPAELPEELFNLVVRNLFDRYNEGGIRYRQREWSKSDIQQLHSYSLVSKRWHTRFAAVLYSHFDLLFAHYEDASRPEFWLFLRTIIENQGLARLITHVRLHDPRRRALMDWEHVWKQCEPAIIEAARRIRLPKRDVGSLKHPGRMASCIKVFLASVPNMKYLSIALPYTNDFMGFIFDQESGQAAHSHVSNLEEVSFHCELDSPYWRGSTRPLSTSSWKINPRSLSPILGSPSARRLTLILDEEIPLQQLIKVNITCSKQGSTVTDMALFSKGGFLSITACRSVLEMFKNLTSLVLQFGTEYLQRRAGPGDPDGATNRSISILLSDLCPNLEMLDYHNSSEAGSDTSFFGSFRVFARLQRLRIQLKTIGLALPNDENNRDFANQTFPSTLQSLALSIHRDGTWNGLSEASIGLVIARLRRLIEDKVSFPNLTWFIIIHEASWPGRQSDRLTQQMKDICSRNGVILSQSESYYWPRRPHPGDRTVEESAQDIHDGILY